MISISSVVISSVDLSCMPDACIKKGWGRWVIFCGCSQCLDSHFVQLAKHTHTHTHTHTHPFNGPMSGTTQVSRYQKDKTNLDFTGARESEWQWHPLRHMQVCTSLQTDNHASTSLLSFFTGRMPFLPPNQQCQSTEVKSIAGKN